MKAAAKVSLVIAGYVAAFFIATAVVAAYVAATKSPDRNTYAAMYDFGDTLLFLGVLGLAAVPATGAGLYFLRPYRRFWAGLSVVALCVATTALAALFDYLGGATSPFSSLRILIAPVFALAFLLAAVFAPNRPSRTALFVATAFEIAAFAYVAFSWFHAPGTSSSGIQERRLPACRTAGFQPAFFLDCSASAAGRMPADRQAGSLRSSRHAA